MRNVGQSMVILRLPSVLFAVILLGVLVIAVADTAAAQTNCTVTSLGSISGTVTQNGTWASDCESVNRPGRYARFYSFSVAQTSDVQIDLASSVDPYMFLLSGAGTGGSVLEYDDDDGPGVNAQIIIELSAGSYTVEATTYSSAQTGSFTLTIDVSLPPPPAPTGVTATVSGQTSILVSWNVVPDAERYKLEQSPNGTSAWSTVDDDISTTSDTASGLICGTTYYFRVSARGDGSPYSTTFGTPSSSESGTTSTCPNAPAPTGLNVTGSTQTSITLGWNAVPDAERYKLERSPNGTSGWTTVSSIISTTSHTANSLILKSPGVREL